MLGNEITSTAVFFPHDFTAGSHYLIELDQEHVQAVEGGEGYVLTRV
jgi:hypothetical protein